MADPADEVPARNGGHLKQREMSNERHMQRSSLTKVLCVQYQSMAVFATGSIKTDRRVDKVFAALSVPTHWEPSTLLGLFRACARGPFLQKNGTGGDLLLLVFLRSTSFLLTAVPYSASFHKASMMNF